MDVTLGTRLILRREISAEASAAFAGEGILYKYYIQVLLEVLTRSTERGLSYCPIALQVLRRLFAVEATFSNKYKYLHRYLPQLLRRHDVHVHVHVLGH